MNCPKDWKPACSCATLALEPDEDCWIHGHPNYIFCPYCSAFRWNHICSRCGCGYGIFAGHD